MITEYLIGEEILIHASPEDIFRELRRIAPDIAFSLYWDERPEIIPVTITAKELDRLVKEGYKEYVVTASAMTVMAGEVYEGMSYLSGFLYKPGERDADLNGWLPHLLWNAAISLSNEFKEDFPQAEAAKKYLNNVRRDRERLR